MFFIFRQNLSIINFIFEIQKICAYREAYLGPELRFVIHEYAGFSIRTEYLKRSINSTALSYWSVWNVMFLYGDRGRHVFN